MIRAVLLPGLGGSGELLTEFAAALAPEFSVLTAAYPPHAILGYDELTELVRQFLPIGEQFLIVAESFSGPIAIRIAATNPEGLIGVVLCTSFARSPRPRLRHFTPLLKAPLPLPPARLLMPLTMGRWSTKDWLRRARHSIGLLLAAVARHRLLQAAGWMTRHICPTSNNECSIYRRPKIGSSLLRVRA